MPVRIRALRRIPWSLGPPGLRFMSGADRDAGRFGHRRAQRHGSSAAQPAAPGLVTALRLLAQVMEELELRRRNLEIARRAAANAEERATLHAMLEQVPGAVCLDA